MQDGDYFDCRSADVINDNVIGMRNEFTRAGYPPKTVQIRMVRELRNRALDVAVQVERRLRIALRNMFQGCGEICVRFSAP